MIRGDSGNQCIKPSWRSDGTTPRATVYGQGQNVGKDLRAGVYRELSILTEDSPIMLDILEGDRNGAGT
jgi:hypothetical protein